MNLIKGSSVVYRPRGLDFDVSAWVDRVHRDGTVTVTARHFLDEDGKPEGGWLGYSYRTKAEHLRKVH